LLTPAENERITRVGPGTPMGTLMRRYWHPACLSSELPERDGAPIRVRLLGEDLIAFRDSTGTVGLVDAFCPHRRAPMFFGRNEACGLRCVYHGWKFDATGACVEMPSEPADSLFKTKVSIAAYPTWEGGGIVWAYLGPKDQQPAPPDYEFVRAPSTHVSHAKLFQDCNWLQAFEGSLDSVHSGFLHCDDLHDETLIRSRRPDVAFETTASGLRGAALHEIDAGTYARTFHYMMPAHMIRGRTLNRSLGPEPLPTESGQLYVPIDDDRCFLYNYLLSYLPEVPLTPAFVDARNTMYGRGPGDALPGFRLRRNRGNDYLIDRAAQKTQTFSGITGMNTQDIALQECMGATYDRSKEHLATSDRVIIAARRMLFDAMDAAERGEAVPGSDPASYRHVRGGDQVIERNADWRRSFGDALVARF
jgi:phthalate 4,5-dioxygenase